MHVNFTVELFVRFANNSTEEGLFYVPFVCQLAEYLKNLLTDFNGMWRFGHGTSDYFLVPIQIQVLFQDLSWTTYLNEKNLAHVSHNWLCILLQDRDTVFNFLNISVTIITNVCYFSVF